VSSELNFDIFDALAGEQKAPADVVPVLQRLVRGVLGIAAE
jgi:hypothetical protein